MDIQTLREGREPKANCEEPNYLCLESSLKLKRKLRKKFDTLEKSRIREFLFNKVILPSSTCEEPGEKCISVLDFYGGGLNVDYIVDRLNQKVFVKNQIQDVKIYTIENNKKLWPAMIEHAKELNQATSVRNQAVFVKIIPFCGSLARFIQRITVKNQDDLDLIWLDYCDMGGGLLKDLETIHPVVGEKTLLAISLFLDRAINSNIVTRKAYVEEKIRQTLPKLSPYSKFIVYSEGDSSSRQGMINFFFKQRYNKLSKEVNYYEAQAPN